MWLFSDGEPKTTDRGTSGPRHIDKDVTIHSDKAAGFSSGRRAFFQGFRDPEVIGGW